MNSGLYNPVLILTIILTFGIAPFVALMVTSYTKLVIVFGLLRAALGLQQVPPNMVLNGIAIILTAYIMAPIGSDAFDAIKRRADANAAFNVNDVVTVYDAVSGPLKAFLVKHTEERNRTFFVQSAKRIWPEGRADDLKSDDMMVLIPSFTLSELTRAFQIGFVVYLVFVVVDLIVAAILLALGMSMIAPTTISVPFKLLLFVMLEGWTQLIQGLVLSYR